MIVTFDETGLITGAHDAHGETTRLMETLRQNGVLHVEIGYMRDGWYVDRANGDRIARRPDHAITLSASEAKPGETVTLAGVPDGARVIITGPAGDTLTADGGPLELSFVLPGAYAIAVDPFPVRAANFSLTIA